MKRPNSLTNEQVKALQRFANAHGRCWKDRLRTWWHSGNQSHPDGELLQQVRNTFGELRFTTKDLWEWADDDTYIEKAYELHDGEDVNVGGCGPNRPEVSIVDGEGAWVQAWVWVPAEIEDEA